LYSTAYERDYIATDFLFAFRQIAGGTPAIRWSRLHFRIAGISPGFLQIRRRNACDPRIAGISPASGCTQPPMSEVLIATAFLSAFRQIAGGTPAILISFCHKKICPLVPQKITKTYFNKQIFVNG
jgi:hypothetical protein